jgi:hypothetical protein
MLSVWGVTEMVDQIFIPNRFSLAELIARNNKSGSGQTWGAGFWIKISCSESPASMPGSASGT